MSEYWLILQLIFLEGILSIDNAAVTTHLVRMEKALSQPMSDSAPPL